MTGMLFALAALALILATVGFYGVSATAASARSRELAIRAAIGAEPGSLLRLVLRQGVVTAAVGVVLGAGASFAATRGLETLLYEVPARDPKTVVLTSLLLLRSQRLPPFPCPTCPATHAGRGASNRIAPKSACYTFF